MDTCWPSTLCVSILKTVESSNNKISQTGVWFVVEIFVPSSVLPLYQTIICVIVAASMAAFDKRPIRKTVIRIQMRESIEKWFVARYSFELNILINHMRWCVGVLYAHRAHTATHTRCASNCNSNVYGTLFLLLMTFTSYSPIVHSVAMTIFVHRYVLSNAFGIYESHIQSHKKKRMSIYLRSVVAGAYFVYGFAIVNDRLEVGS